MLGALMCIAIGVYFLTAGIKKLIHWFSGDK